MKGSKTKQSINALLDKKLSEIKVSLLSVLEEGSGADNLSAFSSLFIDKICDKYDMDRDDLERMSRECMKSLGKEEAESEIEYNSDGDTISDAIENAPRGKRFLKTQTETEEIKILKKGIENPRPMRKSSITIDGGHSKTHVSISGDSYKIKEQIKYHGGVWEPKKKLWVMEKGKYEKAKPELKKYTDITEIGIKGKKLAPPSPKREKEVRVEKKEKVKEEREVKEKAEETVPKKKSLLRMNKWGNYEEAESGIIFIKVGKEIKAVGKQDRESTEKKLDSCIPLSKEDIKLCMKRKWPYDDEIVTYGE